MTAIKTNAISIGLLILAAKTVLQPTYAVEEKNTAVILESQNPSKYMRGTPPPSHLTVGADDSWYRDTQKAQWAFQNISQFMFVAPISRGQDDVVNLLYKEDNILEKEFTGPDGAQTPLHEILIDINVDGFIALKSGKIVVEAYNNGLTPNKRHIVFSVTKTLVGMLAGVLIEAGEIDPNALITDYLPELSQSGFKGATVRDLLDMVAGAEWNKVREDPKSLVNVNAMAGGFIRHPENFPFANTLEFLVSLKTEREHGLKHVYNASNTEALAWVISRATGRPWQDVFADRIWSKLGAEQDAFVVVNEYGAGFATAGFNATLRDLARFGLTLEQGGKFAGRRIIPKSWLKETIEGDSRVRQAWENSTEKKRKPQVKFYKNQTRILDPDKGEFFATGFMGQKIYVNQDADFVAVILSTQREREIIDYHLPLLREIADFVD